MLGGKPVDVPERYAQVSAIRMLPLGIPQILLSWGSEMTSLTVRWARNIRSRRNKPVIRCGLVVFRMWATLDCQPPCHYLACCKKRDRCTPGNTAMILPRADVRTYPGGNTCPLITLFHPLCKVQKRVVPNPQSSSVAEAISGQIETTLLKWKRQTGARRNHRRSLIIPPISARIALTTVTIQAQRSQCRFTLVCRKITNCEVSADSLGLSYQVSLRAFSSSALWTILLPNFRWYFHFGYS